MTQDFGQPKIRYTIIKDFSQKPEHQKKVVVYLVGDDEKAFATFKICECHVPGLLASIEKNLKNVVENKGIEVAKVKEEKHDDHGGYIG